MREKVKDFCMRTLCNLLKTFFIFPIKNNRIIFESYLGKQYTCNPKYIFLKLLNQPESYEIIWSFENPEKYEFLKSDKVKIVKSYGFKFWYYRLTAKITVNNVIWKNFTPIRKGQYEIQTWHGGGGGYKKTLADDKGQQQKEIALERQLRNFKRYSLVLTSSATSLKTNARMAMQYKGVVLGGTPRNDMFIKNDRPELYSQVRRNFGLHENCKIVLYAPTWRQGASKEDYSINYKQLKVSLNERFGGEWIVMRRMHWMAASFFTDTAEDYIAAESYPDMQELLYAIDVLITDYSSSIWDFSFTYKPCFLICLDLNKFKEDRDFYNPIQTWGFPVAQSNEELVENILTFNQDEYIHNMDIQHKKNVSFETGHSADNVCKIIRSQCYGDGSLPSDLPLHYFKEKGETS